MAYFQPAVPCDVDTCDEPAKYQCLNCKNTLCKGCKEKHEKTMPTHEFELYSEREKRTCKRHTNNKNVKQASASIIPLLSAPVVVSSLNIGPDYLYIACTTSSGLAWVKTDAFCIKLMDCDGVVLDTIKTDFKFHDVTVTPQGDVLFSGCDIKCILSASKGATPWAITPLFSTQYNPWGICSLHNSDVVVTYSTDQLVIQYNSEGGIIHEFDRDLLSKPYRVAVNKINEDLYICDRTGKKLLVFDKDRKIRYIYTGSDASTFDPRDVTTDFSGRVLITDEENNRVHVLDKDGEFLHYLQLRGLKAPRYIDVDSEGHLWIGERNGQVKIVKY